MSSNEQILLLEKQFTSGVYPKRDIAIVKGAGAKVWDADGNEYIDCVAGQGVANLGHCHPAIVAAISKQAQTLITCPEIFYNDHRARLIEQLAKILPQGLERIYLCNSGAEAVEAALKFARLSSGRKKIIATMRGFHGRTMGALSVTWEKKYRTPFAPLIPEVYHVPFDNSEKMAETIDEDTAAVIVEIIQGESGVRPASTEYFQNLRELCQKHKTLLIIDEIQTGFGRTGKWFACEHHSLVPDILCMGKAIAGGVPMGAVALGPNVTGLTPGTHGSSFGGNPLACAAALAAIATYEKELLPERSAQLGASLQKKLKELDLAIVRQIRGLGLMVGLELKTRVTPILKALMEKKVLALPAGSTVLRLLPPLVISEEDLDKVVTTIGEVLKK